MKFMQDFLTRVCGKLPPRVLFFLQLLDNPMQFCHSWEQRIIQRERQWGDQEREDLLAKIALLQDENNEQTNQLTSLQIVCDMQERQVGEFNQEILRWQRQFHEIKRKSEKQAAFYRQQQEEAVMEIGRYAGLAEQYRRKVGELEGELEEKTIQLNFHLSRISELQRQQGANPHNNRDDLAQGEAMAFHRRNMPCI